MADPATRIAQLSERARRDRDCFEPPADPPDEDAALEFLVDGVSEAVSVYIEARTGRYYAFDAAEFDALEEALETYIELYAACYGVDGPFGIGVRDVAEAVVETHSLAEAAALVTGVPERAPGEQWIDAE